MSRRSLKEIYLATLAAAEVEHAERRRLVLGHGDLAKRLTALPCRFPRPEQWTGYIPPRMVGVSGGFTYNDSSQRVHLVALVREAMVRQYGEQIAREWLNEINEDHWSGKRTDWTPHTAAEGN